MLPISNPLLLSTGPVLTSLQLQKHKKLINRVLYYFPYIVIGYFLFKVVASPLTNTFFISKQTDMMSTLVWGIIFEIFVYANFAGLSLVIYGVFGVFGVKIPLNFKQPFTSTNIVEYWKGWHISLSKTLKELFYNPARKILPTSMSIFIVYTASAMWHGVTPNFLLWGLFHAAVFIISIKVLRKRIKYIPTLLMFFGYIIGRVIFSEIDPYILMEKLSFQFTDLSVFNQIAEQGKLTLISLMLGLGLVVVELLFRGHKLVSKRNYKFLRTPIMTLLLMIFIILLNEKTGADFAVYGQR
ncbi:MBOAT family O-acyltransferase [Vibrio atlanticus]|uniref:MBOAT family O-acyltransferase n=1 Tax=Vibrio atlanticus TaxID=693153 RepID=UPI003CE674C3